METNVSKNSWSSTFPKLLELSHGLAQKGLDATRVGTLGLEDSDRLAQILRVTVGSDRLHDLLSVMTTRAYSRRSCH